MFCNLMLSLQASNYANVHASEAEEPIRIKNSQTKDENDLRGLH